jgi:hypothetical protein
MEIEHRRQSQEERRARGLAVKHCFEFRFGYTRTNDQPRSKPSPIEQPLQQHVETRLPRLAL